MAKIIADLRLLLIFCSLWTGGSVQPRSYRFNQVSHSRCPCGNSPGRCQTALTTQPTPVVLITLQSAATSRARLIVETRTCAAGEITPSTPVGRQTTRVQQSKLIEVCGRALTTARHAIPDSSSPPTSMQPTNLEPLLCCQDCR